MLNAIWLALILGSILLGGFTGRLEALTQGAFAAARDAVMNIALPLAGLMALWLGFLKLAELSGLVTLLGRALSPLLRRLFPEIPAGHPALGAMVLNMAANMLGLGNAATPLGLRAMRHLESLNPHPGTATNAMCTFLALNTSSVQLIPATAVAILSAQGSRNPTAIVGTAFLATCAAALAGILSVKLLQTWSLFKIPPNAPPPLNPDAFPDPQPASDPKPALEVAPEGAPPDLSASGRTLLYLYVLALLLLLVLHGFPNSLPQNLGGPFPAPKSLQGAAGFSRLIQVISLVAIPGLLGFFVLNAFLRGIKVYEQFLNGAKEGWEVSMRILPPLVAILVGVKMFREAGGIQGISSLLAPILSPLGIPSELLPLILIRPLSGGATTGLFTELVTQFGADSLLARTAATIYGSTETTFYVLAVYFGSVGIQKGRHALPAGLIADATGALASIAVCRWMFS
jgi:spore maturation protein SpmA